MKEAIQLETRVLEGSRIEVSDSHLPVGETVEVIILLPPKKPTSKTSLLDFLDNLPAGPRSASTWEELEKNLLEEKQSWDR